MRNALEKFASIGRERKPARNGEEMDACGISEGTLAKARKERIPVFHVEDNFGPATWVFFVCFGNYVERRTYTNTKK